MPPAWYENASEGDVHDVDGTKWYVKEVNGSVIWWARTKYGKAEACSQQMPTKASPSTYCGPYGYYGSSVGQAYQKSVQGQTKAVLDGSWPDVGVPEGKPGQVRTTAGWVDIDFVDHGMQPSDIVTIDSAKEYKPLTVHDLQAAMVEFHDAVRIPESACSMHEFAEKVGEYWNRRMYQKLEYAFSSNCACGLSGCSSLPAGASSDEQPENDH